MDNSGRVRISAAMIAHNDAYRIEGTIKSVLSFVDQVYVGDLGSGDESANLAKNLGANVLEIPWKNDLSLARNTLLERIEQDENSDFVLWIEPGELFDFRLAGEFRDFLAGELSKENAYMMIVRRYAIHAEANLPQLMIELLKEQPADACDLYPLDGFSDWNEEIADLRLLPVSEKIRFSGRVRESVAPSLDLCGIRVSAAPGRILDVLRLPNHPEKVTKAQKTIVILNWLEESGLALSDDETLAKADALMSLSDIVEARRLYRKLIEQSNQAGIQLEAIYRFDETFNILPASGNERLELLLQGLDLFPVDMQLLTLLGNAMHEQRNFEMAIRVFETAVQHGRISLDVWHKQCVRELAIAHLALHYRITSRADDAIALLESAIEDSPTHNQLAKLLIDLYIAKREEEKLHQFAARYWGDAALDTMRDVFTGACRATAGAWAAALVSLENAYKSGCRDLICLRWYSLTLLSNLRFEEACVILDEWLRYEPGNFEARSFRYAASQPESFHETLSRIHAVQSQSLGIAPDANFDGLALPEQAAPATESPVEGAPLPLDQGNAALDFNAFRFESPDGATPGMDVPVG